MDEFGEQHPEEPDDSRYDVFCPNCGEVLEA